MKLFLSAGLLILAAPLTSAQEILESWDGAGAGAGLGVTATLGDLDGDGRLETILGAPAGGTGSVSVLRGSDHATLFTFSGPSTFGAAVAGAGDVNGDGKADIAVGAPAVDSVWVYSGADGALLWTRSGSPAGGRFGAALASAGDMSGDGKSDLLVGAPDTNQGAGLAVVLSGAGGGTLHSVAGEEPGDHLGNAVCGPPDSSICGDVEPSVLIGATKADGGRGLVQARSRVDFSLRFALAGGSTTESLGVAVALVGDTNGDGTGDLVVSTDPQAGPAVVRLHSGTDGALLRTYTGGSTGSGFGLALAGFGDVDGDDGGDIGIGEPFADLNGLDSGRLHVVSGDSNETIHLVNGKGEGARLGASLAATGDLNGDALGDFLAGAPGESDGGQGSGGAYVVSLTRWNDLAGGWPGVTGIPRLVGQGGLLAQTQVRLVLENARPLSGVTLVLGSSLVIDPALDLLTPEADVVATGLLTSSTGTLEYDFTWPAGMVEGHTLYYVFAVQDPDAPGGEARSNTIAAIVP